MLTPACMFPLKVTCHSLFHQLPARGPGYRLCGQPLEALPPILCPDDPSPLSVDTVLCGSCDSTEILNLSLWVDP